MEKINIEYLGKHKKFRIDSKKLALTFLLLAFIVSIVVFWWLKLVGITVTGEAFCGMDEHTHSQECYAGEQEPECTKKEHIHTSACFPDKDADTETVSDWLETIENVEITNNIPENLIAIAMSQKNYEESEQNFVLDADGNKNGYTRYGEWYGNPYGKWNTMFVSFCLHYSNINNVSDLKASGAEAMRLAWKSKDAYSAAKGYTPQRGDLVFSDNDGDGAADSVGIILSAENSSLTVMSGDSNNRVEAVRMNITGSVMGYGLTGELHFARDKEYGKAELRTPTDAQKTTQQSRPVMMMSASPTQVEGEEDHRVYELTDLTKFIVDAYIETKDGELISDGTVYIGQTYVIVMEFKEDNEGDVWYQFGHNDKHFLTYQIPSNFICEPFTEWHPITAKTESGTIEDVGEYFIDENGFLLVTFYDDENGVCFGKRYSNVDFFIEFNAAVGTTQSGSAEEIIFNDGVTVNIEIDGGAGYNATKTHGSYNSDDHTVDYTITVEATHGVVKELVIDDQIWENHYALRDTIVVTDLEGNLIDPQPVISDHPSVGAEGGFRLSGFPDFAAGEGYLIKYKSQIYDQLLSNDTVGLWNGVDFNAKDSNGNNIYLWKDDWINVEPEKMEKDGKQTVLKDENGNDVPVIEWEVAIKKNNSNLQGTVIIDTLGAGLEYYTAQPILIKHYDEWGNALADQLLSWDNVQFNGNSMSFPLPDGYMFDIFYYTTYNLPDDDGQYQFNNSVSATINGKYETAGGEADVVGFIPHVEKSAYGNDGDYAYFTIEADVPGAIKNWGSFFLSDNTGFWGYKGNAAEYLYVENAPEDLIVTATTDSGRVITFTPYVAGGPTENTYILVTPADDMQHTFKLYFNTSEATNEASTWLLGEDSVLTVTYKIPFDAKTGTEWTGELSGDKTLEDVLLEGYPLSNQAVVNYTNVIEADGAANYKYSPKIIKKAKVNEDGTIDYRVVFYSTVPGTNGGGGYLASADIAYFTDTFDERLEYVPGSLTVTCYDPWNSSNWLNRYRYNGTVSGNSMEIPSTELEFEACNPDCGWDNPWLSTLDTYLTYCKNMGGGEHVFTYTLRLKDKYLYTTDENKYELDNTAEIRWDTDGTSGPASETVEYETGLMDKNVVQENDKLNFDIHINRHALDILPGLDTLTIEDTMTENLSLYWDSIKLYYEDENGGWTDFNSPESTKEYSVTYDQHSNKLTFVVPDSLHIRIDYTTLITQSGSVSVSNTVKIDAKAQIADIIDAVFKIQQHSGGASGSMNSITLLKQDGDTDKPLPDVSFLLYGPVGDKNAVVPDGAQSSIVTDRNKTLNYIGAYTTGDDGTVKITSQYLTNGGPYALVEVSPPEGYMALQKPVYFYYYNADPSGIIQTVTTLIAVENYTYGFVIPETGGSGILPTAIIGAALTALPILYSRIRRKRERRAT